MKYPPRVLNHKLKLYLTLPKPQISKNIAEDKNSVSSLYGPNHVLLRKF